MHLSRGPFCAIKSASKLFAFSAKPQKRKIFKKEFIRKYNAMKIENQAKFLLFFMRGGKIP